MKNVKRIKKNMEIMMNDEADENIENFLNHSEKYITISLKNSLKVMILPLIIFIYVL